MCKLFRYRNSYSYFLRCGSKCTIAVLRELLLAGVKSMAQYWSGKRTARYGSDNTWQRSTLSHNISTIIVISVALCE